LAATCRQRLTWTDTRWFTPGSSTLDHEICGAWPPGKPFHFRQDVERLADMLDRAADVVGHSYGGLLGLQLALARPERVRSLALYEPVAFGVLGPADAEARAQL
jgi:pimeloyl-ACP methyl ester carboxylesterase